MINPSRFTLDSVREFMLANDGRVKNHDLVRHFRFFLTDPAHKDAARVQFKEFVNTLATIKVEDGEKILILKRQFRHDNGDSLSQSSSSSHSTPTALPASMPDSLPTMRTPPPYRPPPQPRRRSPPAPPQQFHAPRAMFHQTAPPVPLAVPRSRDPPQFVNGASGGRTVPPFAGAVGVLAFGAASMPGASICGPTSDPTTRQSWVAPGARELHPPGLPSFSDTNTTQCKQTHAQQSRDISNNSTTASNATGSTGSMRSRQPVAGALHHMLPPPGSTDTASHHHRHHQSAAHSSRSEQHQTQPVPPVRRHKSLDERRLSCSEQRDSGDAFDEADSDGAPSQKAISVREHTKLFNRIASETQLQLPDKRQQYRHGQVTGKNPQSEDDDSASTTTTDGFSKEWCLVSASSNYIDLIRLLKNNPKLAKQKDFVTYTALHWAAKHGNLDTIKLLAGTHAVDVHCRTRGGYTALHIAVQYDHEDAANLLIHTYGADPNMRDYSGKKARQYQQREQTVLSTKAVHKINKRKLLVDKDNGFLRIGSLNVRVKKTTTALNSLISGPYSEDSSAMPPPQSSGVTSSRSTSHSSSTASLLNAAAANARRSVRKRKSRRERDKFDALKSRISAPILLDQLEIAGVHSSSVGQSLSLTELRRKSSTGSVNNARDVRVCSAPSGRIDTGASYLSLPTQLHSMGVVSSGQTTPTHNRRSSNGVVGVASSCQTTPTHSRHGSIGAVGVASSCQTTPTHSRHSLTSTSTYRLSSGASVYDTDCGVDEADGNSDAEYGFDRNWS